MADDAYDDFDLVDILRATKTIAVVGASANPARDSHRVMRYMQANGYRVLPINPTEAGREILGESVWSSLAEAPSPFEMVNVFRRRDAIPGVVDEVVHHAVDKGIRYLWLQIGLAHPEAAARARAAELEVVMDRCLKIEFGRLLSHG